MKEAKIQWHSTERVSGNLGKEDFRKMLGERSRMEEKEDRELVIPEWKLLFWNKPGRVREIVK